MKKVMIIGATSAIAIEAAKVFASEGASLFLVARHPDKLRAVADDLRSRMAKVDTFVGDVNDFHEHQNAIEEADRSMGGIEGVLIAHGTLSDQEKCQQDVDEMLGEFSTNCLSFLAYLTLLGNYFEKRGAGCIAVITSVAGDRGRGSNYVYGAAKAAVTTFLGGLRNRLHKHGVSVVTIKPGFVDTPMTAAYEKGPLFASAESVGKGVYRAMIGGKNVVYLPWFWRGIMCGIRSMPEAVFKRMSL